MGNHTVLCVDDEQNILKSLQRLLRREDYSIVTASSGEEGLELLEKHPMSLVISDQRMPEMTGIQFLKEAKRISPSTIRMILSGYTDIDSITSAVNEGNIYKFILKPWNDGELKLTIKRALEQYDLVSENEKLHEKIRKQNEELKAFNKDLERKVHERTEELMFRNQVLVFSQMLLENLPIAIVGIGEDKIIAYVNKKAQEIYGNNIESFLTLHIDMFFTDEISSLIKDVLHSSHPNKLSRIPYEDRLLDIECLPIDSVSKGQGAILIATHVMEC
ncbi:MAG: response regulator [Thermodesulfobacteriota bacterium]|nr:response regulator [Thermodesulfobacteriota bacterium]